MTVRKQNLDELAEFGVLGYRTFATAGNHANLKVIRCD
jgi:hypothetical protein